ncbi:MAG: hypothetical protein GF365_01685 [Candidatus Buchananbacteria bacterium]|nr:hypothetical protein [Candidatus Buchananbacteria bacterium]
MEKKTVEEEPMVKTVDAETRVKTVSFEVYFLGENSLSGNYLLVEALENKLGISITSDTFYDEAEITKEDHSNLKCLILCFELTNKQNSMEKTYNAWRSFFPDIPIIIIPADENLDYNFIDPKTFLVSNCLSDKKEFLNIMKGKKRTSNFEKLCSLIQQFTK